MAAVWAKTVGTEIEAVGSGADAWQARDAPPLFESPEAGEAGLTPGKYLTLGGARFLVEGLGFLSALMEEGDESTWDAARVRSLREKITGLVTSGGPDGACAGVTLRTGFACKAAASDGTSACGRHKAQDLLTSLMTVLGAFPSEPAQSAVLEGGGTLKGDWATCSVCVRARLQSDAVGECLALGPAGEGRGSVFCHLPDWLENGDDTMLRQPGNYFCLACVGTFPIACQLVSWLPVSHSYGLGSALAEPVDDSAVLAPNSVWAWAPSERLVAPEYRSRIRAFAHLGGIAVPPVWAFLKEHATPSAVAASALKQQVDRHKENTNTARRKELQFEVDAGVALGPAADLGLADSNEQRDGCGGLLDAIKGNAPEKEVERLLLELVEERAAQKLAEGDFGGTHRKSPARAAPAAAAGLSATTVEIQLAELTLAFTELRAQVGQGAGFGGAGLPKRPAHIASPTESDRDGFEKGDKGHMLSLYRASREDYLGALLTKPYLKRREYLVGRERIDHSRARAMMPEESTGRGSEVVMFGETRVEGVAKRMGIPTRGDYEEYAQARVSDLWTQLVEKTGPHVKGSVGAAYAVFETRVILARYKFVHAVEHWLTDVRRPGLAWGAVWRYLCALAQTMWLSQEIESIGSDRDLIDYAIRAPIAELGIRTAPQALQRLASSSIVHEWLSEAVTLHTAYTGEADSTETAGAGARAGADKAPTTCICCLKPAATCGGYWGPEYTCDAECVKPCSRCGVTHLTKGHRGWRCGGAKLAKQHLSAAELKQAFATSYTAFVRGGTGVSAAKIALIKSG
jgi:hypothetical protein